MSDSATNEVKRYKILWFTALGALVGGLLATWLAPKGIIWYFDPPVELGFNCRQPIEWSLRRLLLAQIAGIAAGAIAGIILMLVLKFRKPRVRSA